MSRWNSFPVIPTQCIIETIRMLLRCACSVVPIVTITTMLSLSNPILNLLNLGRDPPLGIHACASCSNLSRTSWDPPPDVSIERYRVAIADGKAPRAFNHRCVLVTRVRVSETSAVVVSQHQWPHWRRENTVDHHGLANCIVIVMYFISRTLVCNIISVAIYAWDVLY
jgi:hypothetical protein